MKSRLLTFIIKWRRLYAVIWKTLERGGEVSGRFRIGTAIGPGWVGRLLAETSAGGGRISRDLRPARRRRKQMLLNTSSDPTTHPLPSPALIVYICAYARARTYSEPYYIHYAPYVCVCIYYTGNTAAAPCPGRATSAKRFTDD